MTAKKECLVCAEKDKEVKQLKERIKAILSSIKIEKKIMWISVGLNIIMSGFAGQKALKFIIDNVFRFLGK